MKKISEVTLRERAERSIIARGARRRAELIFVLKKADKEQDEYKRAQMVADIYSNLTYEWLDVDDSRDGNNDDIIDLELNEIDKATEMIADDWLKYFGKFVNKKCTEA